MNQRGGKRPGAGRKPGATNKRTKEAVAKAQAEGKLPLDVMMEAMRAAYEKGGAEAAFPYAKDAAPYLHAKLSATELNATVNTPPKTLDEFYGEANSQSSAP